MFELQKVPRVLNLFWVVIFSYDLNWTFRGDFDSAGHLIKQTADNNHFQPRWRQNNPAGLRKHKNEA